MIILGIETSCDETAAAVVLGNKEKVKVLSNVVSSQIEIHKKYGGIVPEVAAREHVLNILPVINEALEKAGIYLPLPLLIKEGSFKIPPFYKGRLGGVKKIDAIAVTTGPGLITSLQVGVETAKVLSYVWNIPAVAVNHIEGHIYANFVSANPKSEIRNPKLIFPALILTVSGGHTMLVLMKGHGRYKVIGETVDDAAGEAFDKAATMMEIGYPGGPIISQLACLPDRQATRSSQPNKKNSYELRDMSYEIKLPRPMIYSKDYNFSFSGLKTALLYKIQKDPDWKKRIPEYCFEFQQAVIDVLIHKTIKAAEKYKVKTIMLSGGVAANLELRKQMEEVVRFKIKDLRFMTPDLKYTTDNAAMIAAAGYFKALRKNFTPWLKLKAESDLEF